MVRLVVLPRLRRRSDGGGGQKGTEYRVGDTHPVGPETYIWTHSILRLDRCGRKRNDGNGDHDRLFARWLVEKGRKKRVRSRVVATSISSIAAIDRSFLHHMHPIIHLLPLSNWTCIIKMLNDYKVDLDSMQWNPRNWVHEPSGPSANRTVGGWWDTCRHC